MTTERWALVPVEPTQEALKAIRFGDQTNNRPTYAAVIAASPGAALLAEVLAARDEANDTFDHLPFQQAVDAHLLATRRLMSALDKLGPVQPVPARRTP